MKKCYKIFIVLSYYIGLFTSIYSQDAIINSKISTLENSSNSGNIVLQLYSEYDVKGLQFDLVFKYQELELSESSIISLFDNIDVYVNKVNRGHINILMFGLDGEKIIDTSLYNIVDILEINFKPINKFRGISDIEINNIYIAGSIGEEIYTNQNFIFDVSYYSPLVTLLSKNNPDPFNIVTNIEYQISIDGIVTLSIYDIKGNLIKNLVQEYQISDYYKIIWDGTNYMDQNMPSGKYLLKMNAPKYTNTITLTKLN